MARVQFGMPLPWGHTARIMIATIFMALVLMWPVWNQILPGLLARLLLKTAVGGLVYAGLLALLYPQFVQAVMHKFRQLQLLRKLTWLP